MPLFAYRAINDEGKEVRGTIEAPDQDGAKRALEDIHLEVLDVNEPSRGGSVNVPIEEAPTVQAVATFAFEGQDPDGKTHRGTLQAQSKYEAFKKLRDDQKLILTMLAPMGALPKYNDPDLIQWQRGVRADAPKPQAAAAPVPPPPKPVTPKAPIGFSNVTDQPAKKEPKPAASKPESTDGYHPLVSTLRLYAGWLLGWYAVFVALGYYATERALPWDIPFVQSFYVSPLIFSFVTAIFLFLLLSSINRRIHGRLIGGGVFTIMGLVIFWVVRTSI